MPENSNNFKDVCIVAGCIFLGTIPALVVNRLQNQKTNLNKPPINSQTHPNSQTQNQPQN